MRSSILLSYSAATWAFALATLCALRPAHAGVVIYSFTGENGDGANPLAGVVMDKKGDLFGTTSNGGASGAGTVFELLSDGTEIVLHSFAGGSDGADPVAGLLMGKRQVFYGTTAAGGSYGGGVIFQIVKGGFESILHSFAGGSDGFNPQAGLIADKSGNLYGTTSSGGGTGCGGSGCGVVFELSQSGAYSVLHAFSGSDGANPHGGVVIDRKANLYGTTMAGGASGAGVVFELAANGAETTLHAFTGGDDGGTPAAGLIRDKAGNLYGTTEFGGTSTNFCYPTGRIPSQTGCGAVFKIAKNGTESVLYSFCPQTNCWDGSLPEAGLISDSAGNLYGTTTIGGQAGTGAVFEVAPNGSETTLYSFGDADPPEDGADPFAGLTMDSAGNLYGTTRWGSTDLQCYPEGGCGTVFKIMP